MAGAEEHGETFPRALGVPNHATPPISRGPGSLDDRLHRLLDRMELVVAGEDLVDLPRVLVLLEDHEMPEKFEESRPVEYAADQDFEFQDGGRGGHFPGDRAPDLEPFRIGREGPDPRLETIGDDQHLVVVEERRDLLLVGLELVPGSPDRGVLIHGVLQLDHGQGEAIDEDHDILGGGCAGPSITVNWLTASQSLFSGFS